MFSSYKAEKKNPTQCCIKEYIPAKYLCNVKAVQQVDVRNCLIADVVYTRYSIQNVNTRIATVFHMRLVWATFGSITKVQRILFCFIFFFTSQCQTLWSGFVGWAYRCTCKLSILWNFVIFRVDFLIVFQSDCLFYIETFVF